MCVERAVAARPNINVDDWPCVMRSYPIGAVAPLPLEPLPEDVLVNQWPAGGKVEVSIFCPTYNHSAYIERALCGFLGQVTKYRFEVIIRDDASTDETGAIIRRYAERYPSIIRPIYEQTNQWHKRDGWEVLVTVSRGDYVCICEGDDYWTDARKLQTQIEILRSDPSCSLVYQSAVRVRDGMVVSNDLMENTLEIESAKMMKGVYIPTLSACFRRSDVRDGEYFSKVLSVDTFIWAKLGMKGGARKADGLIPAVYTIHSNGAWTSLAEDDRIASQIQLHYYSGIYFSRHGYRDVAESYFAKCLWFVTRIVDDGTHNMMVFWAPHVQSKRLARYEHRVHGWVHSIMSVVDRLSIQLRRRLGA